MSSSLALVGLLTHYISTIDDSVLDEELGLIGAFLFAYASANDATEVIEYLQSRYRFRVYGLPKSNAISVYHAHEHDLMFRQFHRCGKDAFEKLCAKLEQNPIFTSTGPRRQQPVRIQLATFLHHFGAENVPNLSTVRECGVARGTTYHHYDRIIQAVREMRDQYVKWPTGRKLRDTKRAFGEKGFRHAIGALDGTLIRIATPPAEHRMAYRCRHKCWAVAALAAVDEEGLIIWYDLGWTGNQPDISMWKASVLWNERYRFFGPREYLLVDKGFQITPYTIRPFDENEIKRHTDAEAHELTQLNQDLSGGRIVSEHAYGEIKGRFQGMKNMPGRDVERTHFAIEAMFILHNFFKLNGDKAKDILGYNPKDPIDKEAEGNVVRENETLHAVADVARRERRQGRQHDHQARETPASLKADGIARRREIMAEIRQMRAEGRM